MATECVIRLRFEAREDLEREYRDNLSQGRAFTGAVHPVQPRQAARLLLGSPHAECELDAEVVMVADQGPVQGVGLALTHFDEEARQRLARFVEQAFAAAPAANDPDALEDAAPGDDSDVDDGPSADAADSERPGPSGTPRPQANARLRALRDMGMAEQVKLARKAELADRVALERMLGKTVWDALLRNPRITVAEVARIGRKGTVPRPLLELIVDNAAWVKTGVVRRALLTNPKLSPDMVVRVLKFAPRAELKAMVRNPSCPSGVRTAAKRMLAGG